MTPIGRSHSPRRRARLFFSYAQEDVVIARALAAAMSARGFETFFAEGDALVGENFVRRIVAELRSSDAVIALLSEHSASSDWCQAELYHAHALGIPVMPIVLGGDPPSLRAPLAILQRELQFLRVEGPALTQPVADRLANQLDEVRQRVSRRWFVRVASVTFGSALLVISVGWAMLHVSALQRPWQRAETMRRIERATLPFDSTALSQLARIHEGDDAMLGMALQRWGAPEARDVERLNAGALAGRLMRQGAARGPWRLRDLDWRHSDFGPGVWNDMLVESGSIQNVEFVRTTFAGTVWLGPGTGASPHPTLQAVHFQSCRFEGGLFDGTVMLQTRFTNCRFRGLELNLDGAGGARWETAPSDTGLGVVTDELTSFRGCVLRSAEEPLSRRALDFRSAASEFAFDGVVFAHCRFVGWFAPDRFRRCFFEDCTFTRPGLDRELLATGNHFGTEAAP